MKRVLMIAYHFPPLRGSSGIQRTLKFAQYLPDLGWQPIVLSAHPRAYVDVADGHVATPPGAIVERAFALDTARHLSIGGRYPGWMALPDRWASWWLGAIPAGLRLIREHRPDVIWSTYPIATAHLIGLTLARLSGIPWVADFRDPMAQPDYPTDPRTWRAFRWIETQALRHARRAVFVTDGALAAYRQTFPGIPAEKFALIPNGFDEDDFTRAAGATPLRVPRNATPTLVHSGTIYPEERDPAALLDALKTMLDDGRLRPGALRIVLRATGHDALLARMIDARGGLGGIVELAPSLAYQAALAEMLSTDGLLVLQSAGCNNQVPAKLYEYLRARRPILALTDPAGDTAGVVRAAGIDTIAPLDDATAIAAVLERFVGLVVAGHAPVASDAAIAGSSRRARTVELAKLLDTVLADRSAALAVGRANG